MVYEGELVVVIEDPAIQFDIFKTTLVLFLTRRVVRLLNIWIRASYISVMSLELLQKTYYFMSASNPDDKMPGSPRCKIIL